MAKGWDQGQTELLIKMHGEGATVAQIANATGKTRGACAGKIDRLKRAKETRKITKKVPVKVTPAKPVKIAPPPQQEPEPQEEAEFLAIEFLDLKDKQCRFSNHSEPGEPYLFCGQPTDGGPYCDFHESKMRRGLPKKKKKAVPTYAIAKKMPDLARPNE